MANNDLTVKDIAMESIEITGKTVLSIIPVGGTLITCIWDSVKAHAAQKRMDDWKALVEDRLNSLEMTLDDIGDNELFTSAIMKATDTALRTAETEKREYLANVVRNSLSIPVAESKLMIFLDLIDRNTAWHLKLLSFFRDPSQGGKYNAGNFIMGSPTLILEQVYPDIACDKDMVNKIVHDLQNDGLIGLGDFLNVSMSPQGMLASRTTKLGNEFLDYVTRTA